MTLQLITNLLCKCHLVLTDVTALREAHLVLLDEVETLRGQVRDLEARDRRLDGEVQEVIHSTQLQLNLQLARLQSLLSLHHREVDLHDREVGAPSSVYRYLNLAQEALTGTFALLESLDQYQQARQLRLRLRSVDLNQVLCEVHKDLHSLLNGRVLVCSTADLPTVFGDTRALHMILKEYLTNALKFTRTQPEARIQVMAVEREGEYWIGVEDNGVGFNMRHKDQVFELFRRLHSKETYEGGGIGLAVVRRLCERLGGRAWGEGRVDQGATFWFACPKAPPPRT